MNLAELYEFYFAMGRKLEDFGFSAYEGSGYYYHKMITEMPERYAVIHLRPEGVHVTGLHGDQCMFPYSDPNFFSTLEQFSETGLFPGVH